MGFFSDLFGDKPDRPNIPQPEARKQAPELFTSATEWAGQNVPEAFGARESALADLSLGPEYYASFQPTGFEEALSDQYFKNVWPDVEDTIKHSLSTSGMAYSPVLAEQLGKARGDLGFQVGSYLSNLGNERARYSLGERLSIDPYSTYSPYLTTDIGQSNLQAGVQDQYNQAVYAQDMMDYQNNLAKRQAKIDAAIMLGSMALGGVGAGLGAGGLTAMQGAQFGGMIGGQASPFFGGSGSGQGLGDVLSFANTLPWGQGGGIPMSNSVSGFGGGVSPFAPPSTLPSGLEFGSVLAV